MKVKRIVYMALMVALTYLGSYITPFPAIVSTAALDSMPGFFSAVWLSPASGAIVGACGHFMTALLHGFPLSLPVHLLLTIEMAIICWGFGKLWSKTKLGAVVIATILNGVVSPLTLVVIPGFTMPFLLALVPALLFASVINIGLAAALIRFMPASLRKVA